MKRDEQPKGHILLELAGRSETPIMKAQRIRIGKSNYPAAGKGIIPKVKPRGNVKSNSLPLGGYFHLATPSA